MMLGTGATCATLTVAICITPFRACATGRFPLRPAFNERLNHARRPREPTGHAHAPAAPGQGDGADAEGESRSFAATTVTGVRLSDDRPCLRRLRQGWRLPGVLTADVGLIRVAPR